MLCARMKIFKTDNLNPVQIKPKYHCHYYQRARAKAAGDLLLSQRTVCKLSYIAFGLSRCIMFYTDMLR